ncbi:hypothetical protein RSC3_03414 [Bacillus paralicheniformis]|nr:hypothetical protein RSC3_03414 [Bacillus paralicheniformis]
MLTKEQLTKLENELKAGKEQIVSRFKENGHFGIDVTHPFNSTGDLSAYDNHPGDEGTELYEREKDLALFEHEREHLHDIEHALALIEKGTYGRCEVCGKDIPYERLSVLPTATTCSEHSSTVSVSKDRPIEEEVLNPRSDILKKTKTTKTSHTIQKTLTRTSNATAILKHLRIWPFRRFHTARCTWNMKSRSDMSKITKTMPQQTLPEKK